jgi:transcriptional regulator with XRE-family HTH domain
MSIQEQGDELLKFMGSKVRERRLELDFSVDKLAWEAEIDADLLHSIEEGEKGMSVEIFFRIKQVLEVSFGYLFGEE